MRVPGLWMLAVCVPLFSRAADDPAPAPPVPADAVRLLDNARKGAQAALAKVLPGIVAPPASGISKASDLMAFGNRNAAARPRRIRVRGPVTFVDPSRPWFFLQDVSGAVVVTQGFGARAVKAGDLVEAEGTTRAGTYAPYVDLATVVVVGTAPLPAPKKASAADVRAQRQFSLLTETEGVLRNALTTPDGKVFLDLFTRNGGCMAVVHGAGADFQPASLLGARIRVRGLNWIQFEGQLQITAGPDSIVVVTPGPPRVFEQPAVEAAALPESPSGDMPQLVNAAVLYTDAIGRLWLQAADGTAVVALPAGGFGLAGVQLMPPVIPAAGDAVKVLASFSRDHGTVIGRYAQFHITGRGESLPWPVSTTPKGASDPARLGRLVTLRGRLTGTEVRRFNSFRGGTPQVPVLKMEEDGAVVEIFGPPEAAKEFGALPVDNMVLVTGYTIGRDPTQVWLRTASDFTNEGRSGKSVMQIFRWWLTASGVLVVMGGGFIWALREKLKRQRSEAAMLKASEARVLEDNATLEQRVAERTMELAAANVRLTRASEDALSHLASERELGDLKSNFVSMVSHEFRTPLAVILSSTELLANHLERLSPERRVQQLASIRGSTQQMARLIEEVLLLGKVEAGRMTFTPAPLQLRGFCHSLMDEALSATDVRCRLILTIDPGVPASVDSDPALLRHIFSNLLTNAAKYSPEGAEVRWDVKRDGDRVVFCVSDQGIGIPADDLPFLFVAFHRAKNVGQVTGTGLGLLIVKRCVDLHGGGIAIRSVPGEGTSVTVSIPLQSTPVLP